MIKLRGRRDVEARYTPKGVEVERQFDELIRAPLPILSFRQSIGIADGEHRQGIVR
jgi:hypothetical protein